MSSSPLDWEQLDMIADGFTPEFVEIYHEYLAEIPELMSDLGAQLDANAATEAAKIAHQIKGSSANFGFIGVSKPMEDLEIEAKEGDLSEAARYLAEAKSAFALAVDEVRTLRGV